MREAKEKQEFLKFIEQADKEYRDTVGLPFRIYHKTPDLDYHIQVNESLEKPFTVGQVTAADLKPLERSHEPILDAIILKSFIGKEDLLTLEHLMLTNNEGYLGSYGNEDRTVKVMFKNEKDYLRFWQTITREDWDSGWSVMGGKMDAMKTDNILMAPMGLIVKSSCIQPIKMTTDWSVEKVLRTMREKGIVIVNSAKK